MRYSDYPNIVLTNILKEKSIFTLKSLKTNMYYTYKIEQDKKNKDRFMAKVLYGDNVKNYRYIGLFYRDTLSLRTCTVAHLPHTTPQFIMLQYFLRILAMQIPWPNTYIYYPARKCRKCGKLLTVPESIKLGIGPECLKYKNWR